MEFTREEQTRLQEMGCSAPPNFEQVRMTIGQLNKVNDKLLIHKLIVTGVHQIRQGGLESAQPTDCHFFYMHALNFYYRHRTEEKGLDNAKYFCLQQIQLADNVIPALREGVKNYPLPSHTGYKQLCIIYQKEGRYEAVMRLCQQAKTEGWNGDWDARYEKAHKRLAKK